MSEFLVDTNILVYMYDPRDASKKERAREVVDSLVRAGSAVLSVQCLTEFFRSVRWKLAEPLSTQEALRRVDHLVGNCRVLSITARAALDAMRACEQHSMSFWDSLIWAVAKEGGIPYLLTEDFDDGASVEGVLFVNPFAASFDLGSVLS